MRAIACLSAMVCPSIQVGGGCGAGRGGLGLRLAARFARVAGMGSRKASRLRLAARFARVARFARFARVARFARFARVAGMGSAGWPARTL